MSDAVIFRGGYIEYGGEKWWAAHLLAAAEDRERRACAERDEARENAANILRDAEERAEAVWRPRLAAAEARLAEVEGALRELVALKDHKDAHGKDAEYLRRQPIAWDAARAALAGEEERRHE